ncbi:MAG: ATP-binding protein [bacterium]
MIKRSIQAEIEKKLFKGKAIIITGARQVGKTTLLKMLFENRIPETIFLNCDEPDIRTMLNDSTSTKLKSIAGNKKIIVIDEAQRVKNIGITLKLIVDQLAEYQVIATGSSALELSGEINEPLTGRKYEFNLYPFSWAELVNEFGYLETNRLLEERMIYGMYPEITQKHDEKKELLKSLTQSYLFKDIFSYKELRKPEILEKLLHALALQIGNLVSFHELSNLLKVDNETITKYISILEKAFVIFRLPPYSRNLRAEISRMRKIYFYDTGIRNALLNNFSPAAVRHDIGALWENFIISERLKLNRNQKRDCNMYFWRTQQQQEIDLLEIEDEHINAFEFAWNPGAKKKIPQTFMTTYPGSKQQIINRENFNPFLGIT